MTQISLKSVNKGTLNNGSLSLQVMAWHRTCVKPLPVHCVWRIYELSVLNGVKADVTYKELHRQSVKSAMVLIWYHTRWALWRRINRWLFLKHYGAWAKKLIFCKWNVRMSSLEIILFYYKSNKVFRKSAIGKHPSSMVQVKTWHCTDDKLWLMGTMKATFAPNTVIAFQMRKLHIPW